jgi:hypothetical protein
MDGDMARGGLPSVDLGWDLVEAFATQPRERPADVNTGADMIAERLRRIGLTVTMHEPRLFLSLPGKASVSAGGRTFRGKPPAFSEAAPGGLTGPLLYVPGQAKEVMGSGPVDPDRYKGKIVVTEGMGLPMVLDALEKAGALGVVCVNPGERIHWGTASTIWGTPEVEDVGKLPGITSVAVSNADGLAIIAIAKAGGEATLFSELDVGWFPQKLPVVEIPGTVEPDQFVFVHGHYDSWDVGVGDNGTGNACMLELARLLHERRGELRRSVRLAWWPAHSTGRYGGSAWYLDAHAMDFAERCVVHMNCDSPGCIDATDYRDVVMMPEVRRAVSDVIHRVTGQTAHGKRPNRSSDYTFYNIGISAAFMASSMLTPEKMAERGITYRVGGCGGNLGWHAEDDTLDIADKSVLAKDTALYLEAVFAFATPEVLPVDWRDAVDDLMGHVDAYQSAAGARFDLGPARAALVHLRRRLDAFAVAQAAGRIPAKAANALVRDLARDLVPLNFAKKGPFVQDPAMNLPPIPVLGVAAELDRFDDHTIGFALTTLLRGRNHVEATARRAAGRIDAALGA